jgi:hypothetical protein
MLIRQNDAHKTDLMVFDLSDYPAGQAGGVAGFWS